MAQQQQQQQQAGERQDVQTEGGATGAGVGGASGPGIQRAEPEKGAGIERRQQRGGAMGRAESASPFSMMSRLMNEMDRFFSGFGGGIPSALSSFGMEPFQETGIAEWSPTVETFTRGNQFVVRADLPGLTPEDVKVQIANDELVISGERTENKEETIEGRRYSERSYGSFERRFALPEGVDPNSVDASFENGVLEVCIAAPEQRKPQTRKVEVKSGRTPAQGQGGSEPIH